MATRGGKGNVLSRKNADGSLRHEAYARVDGKKRYIGSFPSKRLAQDALDDAATEQRKRDRGELPKEFDSRRTFAAVAKEWLGGKKRARSRDGYERELARNVYEALGGVPIAAVTAKAMADLQSELMQRPGLSARSVAHTMAIVASIVRHAWKHHYIPNNPATALEIVQYPERSFNWIRTRAEIERLLAACDDPHRTMYATLVMTGMRRNELVYLDRLDVDLSTRLICIQRGPHGMPKGKRLRYVPISDALLPVLTRWCLMHGQPAGLLFPGTLGRPRAMPALSRHFKRSLGRAGLDTSVRLHDLRHSYASHFVRDGGDIFRLSKYLGHASVLITERIYAHLVPDDYAQDWGRVAIRVRFEDADVVDMSGEKRESESGAGLKLAGNEK
jgi:integrase